VFLFHLLLPCDESHVLFHLLMALQPCHHLWIFVFVVCRSVSILRKVNKLALTALRLAASRKATRVEEAILLDATAEALL